MRLTAAQIAQATAGQMVAGDGDHVIEGFSIDTRTLCPGDLYFAIRGTRLDGHDFVHHALTQGACGVVVSDPACWSQAGKEGRAVVVSVADTTQALQDLARYIRARSGTRVVAITGSVGKTTTKEVAAVYLGTRYRVFRNKGNLNNHIGLPLSLLALRDEPDVAVVELGMNHAGEISRLVAIASPDLRVWTNVAPVHAEFFESIESIAEAKAEIFEGAEASTVLVAPAGDPRITARLSRFAGQIRTFGIETAADVVATEVRLLGVDGIEARVQTPSGVGQLHTPLLGLGNLANVLAAMTTSLEFGVGVDDMLQQTAVLSPPPHRGVVLRLDNGVTVIDDSYNSNPEALERALETVGTETRAARRVAVLGEMLELGQGSVAWHRQCGHLAVRVGVDMLVTVGGVPAEAMAEAAVEAGLAAAMVWHFDTSAQAAEPVAGLVQPHDLVLVKGSRGIRTELIVDRLQSGVG